MSIWNRLAGAAGGLFPADALGRAASMGRSLVRRRLDKPERARVAFTIAAIALAAKMAAADGMATQAEFQVFERLFRVPEHERVNAARFYRLAQGSTAGFERYADQAAASLGAGSPVLEDLLEALLLIATVDGVHPAELAYLDAVAPRLGFDAAAYARIRARHLRVAADDPWRVLGLEPGADREAVRAAYRALVKRHHPDRHFADGTPTEFIRVAEARMAAINAAYATLTA